MPDSSSTPNVPAPETLTLPPSYELLDYIEAGLRANGIEQEFIDEAKRQIHAQIAFTKLSPEEKKAKLDEFAKQKHGVKSSDATPMPTAEEINRMYEARFLEAKDNGFKGVDDALGIDNAVEVVVRAMDEQDKVRRGIPILTFVPAPKPTIWGKVKSLLTFWR